MLIKREKVKEAFVSYVNAYNQQDQKIKLKIDHTYRVAELCDRISESLALSNEDRELAWLIGMLHDIGRFEQLRQYGTFIDADSMDHAKYGVRILFEEGKIRNFLESSMADDMIRIAIGNHSAFKLPENLTKRERMFCNIIRDADKIDILKVNSLTPLEDIYNVSTEELKQSEVSKEVLESFYEEHAVAKKYKKTPADHVVGAISLVYELIFPISYQIMMEQGYLHVLMDFHSDNPVTRKQFEEMKQYMETYIASKLNK